MQAVEFVFSQQWRHAGVDYKPGDVAKIAASKAEKLKKLGAGEVARKGDAKHETKH